jgi:hypothetical protein
MEAMLGISLYSYLYLKLAEMLCLIISMFSTKLEKKAKQVLPGSKGVWGRRKGVGGRREKWPNVYTYE